MKSKYVDVDLTKMSWQAAKVVINNSHDLRLEIADNMKTYGGSFVKNLAECIFVADPSNTRKLVNAFYKYFIQYQPKNWERKS